MILEQYGYIHRWFAGKKEKAMSNMELQETDYKWFLENYKMLYEQYGVSYLAIKNKTVLGSYSSYAEALHETEKSEPIGSFIIQFCNGNESDYYIYVKHFLHRIIFDVPSEQDGKAQIAVSPMSRGERNSMI